MNQIEMQLKKSPIIAAVKDKIALRAACVSDIKIVFILGSDIFSIKQSVASLKKHNKIVFVHMDLVEGLGRDKYAVKYLAKEIMPDGIISTRHNILSYAKTNNMLTVQRMFLLDSTSITSGVEMARKSQADFVELVPGIIPKAIVSIKRHINKPIIVGGMVTDIREIKQALKSGAVGISSSRQELWNSNINIKG